MEFLALESSLNDEYNASLTRGKSTGPRVVQVDWLKPRALYGKDLRVEFLDLESSLNDEYNARKIYGSRVLHVS